MLTECFIIYYFVWLKKKKDFYFFLKKNVYKWVCDVNKNHFQS